MRKAGLGVAFAAAALATCTAAAPANAAGMRLGFIDQQYAQRDKTAYAADLTTLNARVLRYNAFWNTIGQKRPKKPRDPADPAYNWKALDQMLRDATAYGKAQVMLTFWGTPKWARWAPAAQYAKKHAPTMDFVIPEPRFAGDFAYALAARYSGKFADPLNPGKKLPYVRWFEIGNEASIANGMYPQCLPVALARGAYPRRLTSSYGCPNKFRLVAPRLYARLLVASSKGIKQAGKAYKVTQKVLGLSLSNKHSRPFLMEMRKELGKNPPFDAIAVHPYNALWKLGVHDLSVPDGVTVASFRSLVKLVDRLWPKKRYRFWITEYGWQTFPDRFGAPVSKQGTYLKQAITTFRNTHRVDVLVNYLLIDEAIGSTHGNSWQSGLRYLNGKKKPAYTTWQQIARVQ